MPVGREALGQAGALVENAKLVLTPAAGPEGDLDHPRAVLLGIGDELIGDQSQRQDLFGRDDGVDALDLDGSLQDVGVLGPIIWLLNTPERYGAKILVRMLSSWNVDRRIQ